MWEKEFNLLQHKTMLKVKKVLLKYEFTFNLYFSYFYFDAMSINNIETYLHTSHADTFQSIVCTSKVFALYGRTWTAEEKYFAKSHQSLFSMLCGIIWNKTKMHQKRERGKKRNYLCIQSLLKSENKDNFFTLMEKNVLRIFD